MDHLRIFEEGKWWAEWGSPFSDKAETRSDSYFGPRSTSAACHALRLDLFPPGSKFCNEGHAEDGTGEILRGVA